MISRRTQLVTNMLALLVIVNQVTGDQTSAPRLQNTTVNKLRLPELSVLKQQVSTYQRQLNSVTARLGHIEEQFQLYKNEQTCSRPLGFRNVALNRPTSQSSIHGGLEAFLAVDGNADGQLSNLSCTHTERVEGSRSWWQVDLQCRHNIKSVAIFNRVDCCSERLRAVDIYIYEEDPTINPAAPARLCHHFAGTMPRSTIISCDAGSLPGRYVRIVNVASEYLTLCEVQVFALPTSPTRS